MQTGNPDELKLLHITRGGKIFEDELHAEFNKYHYRGEWFHPCQEILDYIAELKIRDQEDPGVLSIVEFTLAWDEPLTTVSKQLLQEMVNGVQIDDSPYMERYRRLFEDYQCYCENPVEYIAKYGEYLKLDQFQ